MTWVIAIAGFCALIVSHEAGHFLAAKAVGMRVERFSLFFPPEVCELHARRDRVPDRRAAARRLREDHRHDAGRARRASTCALADRTYYMKAPWKRIVVILAGPGVNLLLAFVLFTGVLLSGSLDGATAIGNSQLAADADRSAGAASSAVEPARGASGLLQRRRPHRRDRRPRGDARRTATAALQPRALRRSARRTAAPRRAPVDADRRARRAQR